MSQCQAMIKYRQGRCTRKVRDHQPFCWQHQEGGGMNIVPLTTQLRHACSGAISKDGDTVDDDLYNVSCVYHQVRPVCHLDDKKIIHELVNSYPDVFGQIDYFLYNKQMKDAQFNAKVLFIFGTADSLYYSPSTGKIYYGKIYKVNPTTLKCNPDLLTKNPYDLIRSVPKDILNTAYLTGRMLGYDLDNIKYYVLTSRKVPQSQLEVYCEKWEQVIESSDFRELIDYIYEHNKHQERTLQSIVVDIFSP